MKRLTASARARFKKVRFLLLDVDGVLTDGRIVYDSNGADARFYDVHDGLGVYLLGRMGVKTVLITAKGSRSLKPRARDMRVEAVYENILPKTKAYEKILKRYRLRDRDVCFMGDDLLDLAVMRRAGVAAAPAQAASEVKQAADYVTRREGGRGAVREVVELILRCKGLWPRALKIYE